MSNKAVRDVDQLAPRRIPVKSYIILKTSVPLFCISASIGLSIRQPQYINIWTPLCTPLQNTKFLPITSNWKLRSPSILQNGTGNR